MRERSQLETNRSTKLCFTKEDAYKAFIHFLARDVILPEYEEKRKEILKEWQCQIVKDIK